jgi:hypothetical protein
MTSVEVEVSRNLESAVCEILVEEPPRVFLTPLTRAAPEMPPKPRRPGKATTFKSRVALGKRNKPDGRVLQPPRKRRCVGDFGFEG